MKRPIHYLSTTGFGKSGLRDLLEDSVDTSAHCSMTPTSRKIRANDGLRSRNASGQSGSSSLKPDPRFLELVSV